MRYCTVDKPKRIISICVGLKFKSRDSCGDKCLKENLQIILCIAYALQLSDRSRARKNVFIET